MGARIDETGKRYGHLTVLRRATKEESDKSGHVCWLCLCDCGTEKVIPGNRLRNGQNVTCGCKSWRIDTLNLNDKLWYKTDLVNKKFGKLSPIKYIGNGKWLCQCDCGELTEVIRQNLVSGGTVSCGKCITRYKDITGKQFGKLTVLEYAYYKKKRAYWKCKCECGNISYHAGVDLIAGKINSCGCTRSFGEQEIRKYLLSHNIEYIQEKTFENCKNPKTNALLRFDFYIPSLNLCIEYDGQHHSIDYKNTLKEVQYRDKIKNKFCSSNKIQLVRISYEDFEEIENILDEIFEYDEV